MVQDYGADSDGGGSLLPGQWLLIATNRSVWLRKSRRAPTVTIESFRSLPLTLLLSYSRATPRTRRHQSQVRLRMAPDGWLTSRGIPLIRGRVRRTVAGASDDAAIVVVLVEESPAPGLGRWSGPPHGGIEILLRVGELSDGVRASVARSAQGFGLEAEDFASLAWADERGHF